MSSDNVYVCFVNKPRKKTLTSVKLFTEFQENLQKKMQMFPSTAH